MQFYKFQGTGNDFVIIDDRNESFDTNDLEFVRKLCNRKFGIGADGLILLRNHKKLDFHMIYFNANGSQSFCGNGSRCAVKLAHELKMIDKKTRFLSTDGEHEAEVLSDGQIALQMHDVHEIKDLGVNNRELNTGSPHYVRFVEDLRKEDVVKTGRSIRYSPPYSEDGINVNVVQQLGKNAIAMKTYERGVEDETLSCGTGVTAAVLAFAYKNNVDEPCEVTTRGGKLKVTFERNLQSFTNIYLIGPAEKVFIGEW